VGDYHYGACLVPDEDDMKITPVRYGAMLDINGYLIEVHENSAHGAVSGKGIVGHSGSKIILYVEDLDESIAFYTGLLGMNLYRKRSNVVSLPKDASMVAHVVCFVINFL
jgi:catechol-2,3-dioxygenase